MSVTAIADASTGGLWYGRACSIVRKRICLVRWAAAAKSAVGFAEIENFGKKKCSMTAYTSYPRRSAFSICSRTSPNICSGVFPGWSSISVYSPNLIAHLASPGIWPRRPASIPSCARKRQSTPPDQNSAPCQRTSRALTSIALIATGSGSLASCAGDHTPHERR
jgi:hypothetical protein